MGKLSTWNLNKWIIIGLLGAFVGLLLDLRYEHSYVLKHNALSWTPLLYSGLMIVSVLAFMFVWDRGGRKVLQFLFAAGVIVGVWGYYLHNHGQIIGSIVNLFAPWTGKQVDIEGPPVMAPMAFAGLGALGWLASLKRFQAPAPEVPAAKSS